MIYALLTTTKFHLLTPEKPHIEGGMKKHFFFGYFICNQNLKQSNYGFIGISAYITIRELHKKFNWKPERGLHPLIFFSFYFK